jgi:hypothetical protein
VWRVWGGALLQRRLRAPGLAGAPADVPAAGGSSGSANSSVTMLVHVMLPPRWGVQKCSFKPQQGATMRDTVWSPGSTELVQGMVTGGPPELAV